MPNFLSKHVLQMAKNMKFIKLDVRSEDGGKISFKLKQNVSLSKLRMSYSERVGLPVSSLRFFVNGSRINDETPDQLEIEDGEEVDVFREQGGKSQESGKSGDVAKGSAVFPRIQEEKGIPSPIPSRKLGRRIVFCHIESLRLSSSPELHLTQLAGACHNPQANVFLPVLPSILPGYLNNYKLGGDIMRTLNLIENNGSYLFRPSVLVENTPGIEYVDEDQALRTFLDFLDMIGSNIILVMKSMIIIV